MRKQAQNLLQRENATDSMGVKEKECAPLSIINAKEKILVKEKDGLRKQSQNVPVKVVNLRLSSKLKQYLHQTKMRTASLPRAYRYHLQ